MIAVVAGGLVFLSRDQSCEEALREEVNAARSFDPYGVSDPEDESSRLGAYNASLDAVGEACSEPSDEGLVKQRAIMWCDLPRDHHPDLVLARATECIPD
jgi:hypothetical protein